MALKTETMLFARHLASYPESQHPCRAAKVAPGVPTGQLSKWHVHRSGRFLKEVLAAQGAPLSAAPQILVRAGGASRLSCGPRARVGLRGPGTSCCGHHAGEEPTGRPPTILGHGLRGEPLPGREERERGWGSLVPARQREAASAQPGWAGRQLGPLQTSWTRSTPPPTPGGVTTTPSTRSPRGAGASQLVPRMAPASCSNDKAVTALTVFPHRPKDTETSRALKKLLRHNKTAWALLRGRAVGAKPPGAVGRGQRSPPPREAEWGGSGSPRGQALCKRSSPTSGRFSTS